MKARDEHDGKAPALADWSDDAARAARDAFAAHVFEAPAGLQEAVLREARAMEHAQETRRTALRESLARGDSVEEALGAAVTPQTEAWLRGDWLAQSASGAVPEEKPRGAWRRQRWAFGASFALALLIGVAIQYDDWRVRPAMDAALPAEVALAPPAEFEEKSAAKPAQEPVRMERAQEVMPAPAFAPPPMSAPVFEPPPPSPPPSAPMASVPPRSAGAPVMAKPDRGGASSRPADSARQTASGVIRPPARPSAPMASAPPGNAGAPVTAKSDRARALVSSRAADSRQTASVQADRTGEPSGIWPLDSERWQELAARLAAETPDAAKRAADGSSREWRLYTRAPDAPEARRLALRLRAALPAGAQLSVIADTAIPGGYARLAPP